MANTAQQGRIDSARLFGTAFGRTLLERAGCRRQIQDPEAWEYHAGPLANSAADLEKILAACSGMPPTAGAPPGWAVFGRHVDDGIGIANRSRTVLTVKAGESPTMANPTIAYLITQIRMDWALTAAQKCAKMGTG